MAALPPGAMLAVPCGEQEARALCGAGLSLAAVNGPQAAVLSGPLAAIEALERRLIAEGRSGTRLRASHAFHSAMMDPILDDLRAVLRRSALNATVAADASAPPKEIIVGELRLNLDARSAVLGVEPLVLTPVEFDLLACLLAAPGRVFTRAQLIDRVWGDGFAITDLEITFRGRCPECRGRH
mgnify:CR=1 FL=1